MTINAKVVLIETSKIKPYNRNARNNDETVLKLCEIIPKVGFNQPIVIDKNNVIVKGHSRWKAAVRLGMEKVPCIISENDEETNKLDRLADNKIQEFSTWDDELLATELASVNLEDIDLSDFGFDFDSFSPVKKTDQTAVYAAVEDVPMTAEAPVYKPAYTPPAPDENYITESDVEKTVPNKNSEYGVATCPKCGTHVLYKK